MAEEIIDLRDRIEKMRIQIENEAPEQISVDTPLEIQHKTNSSNISLSLQEKNNQDRDNDNINSDSQKNLDNNYRIKSSLNKKETFPALSLSVKNPVSSKILIVMIIFQIFSNVGILYFLYLGME